MESLDGNGPAGTISGTAVGVGITLVPGQIGSALNTDSANYVDYGSQLNQCFAHPAACTSGVTYSFWISFPNSPSPDIGKEYILDNKEGLRTREGLFLRRNAGGTLHTAAYIPNTYYSYKSYATIKSPAWVHVVLMWSQNEGYQMYLNGCKDSSSGENETLADGNKYADRPFFIGGWYSFTAGLFKDFATMKLDHVLIWYQVLSTDDVWSLYSQGGALP